LIRRGFSLCSGNEILEEDREEEGSEEEEEE
jgi:hypothetical protein